jgi:hypothetical protein
MQVSHGADNQRPGQEVKRQELISTLWPPRQIFSSKQISDMKSNMERSVHCFAQLASYKKGRMASETSIGTGVPSLYITVAHRTLNVRQENRYKRKTTNSNTCQIWGLEWKQQVCSQRQHVSVKLQGAEHEVAVFFLNFLCRYDDSCYCILYALYMCILGSLF